MAAKQLSKEEIIKVLDRIRRGGIFSEETIILFKENDSWYQRLSSSEEAFVDGFIRGIRYMEGRKDD